MCYVERRDSAERFLLDCIDNIEVEMQGNMMDEQMLITDLLEHAAACHGQSQIVSGFADGSVHRYTYADAAKRTKQLANALQKLGVEKGDCIGTLAWNDYRHYELYFGISGVGAVTHTINPRLFTDQITYIINHAQNTYLFLDPMFVPLLEGIKDKIDCVRGFVILTDAENMPATTLPNVLCYEDLIKDEPQVFEWPRFSEETAASLCYTSGTTGNPKGVLYSHKSTLLHSRAVSGGEGWALNTFSVVMPVVPMFHASAWGIPYSATQIGAKLVLPGPALDGASLYTLICNEKVDAMCGVPTVWQGLLEYADKTEQTLGCVNKAIIGGSAVALSMIREFEEKHGVFVMHGWGMTEMSPVGAVNYLTAAMIEMPLEERYQLQLKQGKPLSGIKMKIVDDQGREQPRDGKSFGRLLVRGPWVAKSYFKSDDRSSFTDDGWFDTGDVSTIDENCYMQIVDRAKDVIKSGGEWISSIELENTAQNMEAVIEACVIGVPHDKWGERPLLLVTVNTTVTKENILQYLSKKVSRWWLPDDVIVVSELPHTATGKVSKMELRKHYHDHLMEMTQNI